MGGLEILADEQLPIICPAICWILSLHSVLWKAALIPSSAESLFLSYTHPQTPSPSPVLPLTSCFADRQENRQLREKLSFSEQAWPASLSHFFLHAHVPQRTPHKQTIGTEWVIWKGEGLASIKTEQAASNVIALMHLWISHLFWVQSGCWENSAHKRNCCFQIKEEIN